MKARELMRTEPLWACSWQATAQQVSSLMAQHDIGSVPVLDDDGGVRGVITDRDIAIRLVAQGRSLDTAVRQIMSQPVRSVRPDADLREVETLMRQYRVRRVPVVDENNTLQGVISICDLAHVYHGLRKEHRLAELLDALSTRTPELEPVG